MNSQSNQSSFREFSQNQSKQFSSTDLPSSQSNQSSFTDLPPSQSKQSSLDNFPIVMSKLYSQSENERLSALPELLKYGQLGEDLLNKIVETETDLFREAAINQMISLYRNKIESLSNEILQENQAIEKISRKLDIEINLLEEKSQQAKLKIEELEQKLTKTRQDKQMIDQEIANFYQSRKKNEEKEKEKIISNIENKKTEIEAIRMKAEDFLLSVHISYSGYESNIDNNQDKILAKLRFLIVEQLNVTPEIVTLNANISNDLGADDLDGTEMIMAVEQEFDIEITDQELDKHLKVYLYHDYTVKDLFEFILMKIKA